MPAVPLAFPGFPQQLSATGRNLCPRLTACEAVQCAAELPNEGHHICHLDQKHEVRAEPCASKSREDRPRATPTTPACPAQHGVCTHCVLQGGFGERAALAAFVLLWLRVQVIRNLPLLPGAAAFGNLPNIKGSLSSISCCSPSEVSPPRQRSCLPREHKSEAFQIISPNSRQAICAKHGVNTTAADGQTPHTAEQVLARSRHRQGQH